MQILNLTVLGSYLFLVAAGVVSALILRIVFRAGMRKKVSTEKRELETRDITMNQYLGAKLEYQVLSHQIKSDKTPDHLVEFYYSKAEGLRSLIEEYEFRVKNESEKLKNEASKLNEEKETNNEAKTN